MGKNNERSSFAFQKLHKCSTPKNQKVIPLFLTKPAGILTLCQTSMVLADSCPPGSKKIQPESNRTSSHTFRYSRGRKKTEGQLPVYEC